MTDPAATAELLRRVVGRRLEAVTEARYWHEGVRDGDAGSLLHFWLHVDGNPPLMVHGAGEDLSLSFSEPYESYDMEDQGETRVGPAAAPDVLAGLPGQRLLDAALIQRPTPVPSVGGVLLRCERLDLVVASVGDEWVLTLGAVPPVLGAHLVVGDWVSRAL
ncbi:hypothetical protein [Micromonospora chersina]|uniref:hypothetical protein n=1 Tax=Micromonospora chersina TaxID=47854 RepID=UPI00371AEB8B